MYGRDGLDDRRVRKRSGRHGYVTILCSSICSSILNSAAQGFLSFVSRH
jgi:hypothetical protein